VEDRCEALLFLVISFFFSLGEQHLRLGVEALVVRGGEDRLPPAEVDVTLAVIQVALVYSAVHEPAGG